MTSRCACYAYTLAIRYASVLQVSLVRKICWPAQCLVMCLCEPWLVRVCDSESACNECVALMTVGLCLARFPVLFVSCLSINDTLVLVLRYFELKFPWFFSHVHTHSLTRSPYHATRLPSTLSNTLSIPLYYLYTTRYLTHSINLPTCLPCSVSLYLGAHGMS